MRDVGRMAAIGALLAVSSCRNETEPLMVQTDRLEVTTPRGTRHEFAHRGTRVCETDVNLFAE